MVDRRIILICQRCQGSGFIGKLKCLQCMGHGEHDRCFVCQGACRVPVHEEGRKTSITLPVYTEEEAEGE